ncbi:MULTISPECIES: helix-turn-helix domain-containing protein [Aliivibrio]|uniref:AraC family transcriptional regulator n=1 Tax=Aliivibrio TaxID=511678 RepID=UPI00080D9391|nr:MULTISPECIES: helix-turn-helix transcriptional regulator [Aliivibrio]MBD1569380.1 helix-turn-helix transcriptional regulator [Aliivibrio sp. S10_S31]OCH09393.1 AraC family transcriptional regulator [Aliivibrio fischeri]OCH27620.1 AraC family transcriptional regulator [Aliivibrio fischeri]
MAIISDETKFDADKLPADVIGIAADVGRHDSGMHYHQKGQLLYAPEGCMSFALSHSMCVLPPTKAVWIPANTPHRAFMTNVVAYRSLYFDCDKFSCPEDIVMIEVDELLRALINKMAMWPWDKPKSETLHTTALFWESFYEAHQQPFSLPLPTEKRLITFSEQVQKPDFLAPDLQTLSKKIGASSKTITRLFKKETGMSYQEWKQQWRVLKSIELLCENTQVSDVAFQLDFSSDSAFISFFKKQVGQTPLVFIKQKQNKK